MGITLEQFERTLAPTGQSTGTWSRVGNAGNPYWTCTGPGGTATKNLYTISPERRTDTATGAQVVGLIIWVRLATANLVSVPSLTVYRRKSSLGGGGTNLAVSTVAGTLVGAKLTAAATDQKLVWTATTPTLDYSVDANMQYFAELKLNPATTTAMRVYDGIQQFILPV